MPTPNVNRPSRFGRSVLGGAAIALLAAVSAGCSTTSTYDANPVDFDYRLRHPIMISEEPEVFDMKVGMNGPALSPEIETALDDYVADYQADGTGAITIQVPTGSANEVAAASTGRAIHYALVRSGVPRGQIHVRPYYFGDHAKVASVRVSYLRVKAVAPRCGLWPEEAPVTYKNANYHNFGCASQQNLAAMVANPADLVRPREMTPANGKRRANVIMVYTETGNPGWAPAPESQLIDSGGFQ